MNLQLTTGRVTRMPTHLSYCLLPGSVQRYSFLTEMSLIFIELEKVSQAHEGPVSLQRLMRLDQRSHSGYLLIFFLLPRTGLLIAFLVVSGSVKAMEDHSLFAGYKLINKVKCKEVQCIYFIIA